MYLLLTSVPGPSDSLGWCVSRRELWVGAVALPVPLRTSKGQCSGRLPKCAAGGRRVRPVPQADTQALLGSRRGLPLLGGPGGRPAAREHRPLLGSGSLRGRSRLGAMVLTHSFCSLTRLQESCKLHRNPCPSFLQMGEAGLRVEWSPRKRDRSGGVLPRRAGACASRATQKGGGRHAHCSVPGESCFQHHWVRGPNPDAPTDVCGPRALALGRGARLATGRSAFCDFRAYCCSLVPGFIKRRISEQKDVDER